MITLEILKARLSDWKISPHRVHRLEGFYSRGAPSKFEQHPCCDCFHYSVFPNTVSLSRRPIISCDRRKRWLIIVERVNQLRTFSLHTRDAGGQLRSRLVMGAASYIMIYLTFQLTTNLSIMYALHISLRLNTTLSLTHHPLSTLHEYSRKLALESWFFRENI